VPEGRVLDASVLVPLVVETPNSAAVAAALAPVERWVCPDLALVELANALRSLVQGRALGALEAASAFRALPRHLEVVSTVGLVDRALDVALGLGHPVYDCVYLVLAEREGLALLSFDDRLRGKLVGTPWARLVQRPGG
jgi:predicted nucleic acid-binding protein